MRILRPLDYARFYNGACPMLMSEASADLAASLRLINASEILCAVHFTKGDGEGLIIEPDDVESGDAVHQYAELLARGFLVYRIQKSRLKALLDSAPAAAP